MKSILDEFIRQTYGSSEQALQADLDANKREQALVDLSKNFEQKAMQHISNAGKPISVHIDIPTLIVPGSLDEKPKSHPQFADYDHNLEKERWGDLT